MYWIFILLKYTQTSIVLITLLSLLFFALDTKPFSNELQVFRDEIGVKGSFVIAAICKDGIIIASDSRGNIFDNTDKQQTPIAYFDTIQKIFPIGSNAIAETGQGLILNIFFSAIVKDFINHTSDIPVDMLLPTFIEYCDRQLPSKAVIEIRKQKLFAIGYMNDSPAICYYNKDQPEGCFGCIQDHGFIESAPTILMDEKELTLLSCKQAAARVKNAIQMYAKENERWKTIGGPISILFVSKTGPIWIENQLPAQRWTYIQAFVSEYQKGKIKLHLIPPATKQQLDNLMDTVPMSRP
jgi:hypothetical protein